MHVDKKAVIQNVEMAREIAKEQFGDTSPKIVLKVARLIAGEQQRQAIGEVADSLSYPLEIATK